MGDLKYLERQSMLSNRWLGSMHLLFIPNQNSRVFELLLHKPPLQFLCENHIHKELVCPVTEQRRAGCSEGY